MNLSPPLATLPARCWFLIGEPVRTAEAILTDLFECHTDALHDLLADLFSFFSCADCLNTGFAEFLQERVTPSGAEPIHGYICDRGMKLRKIRGKHQTFAAFHGIKIGRAAATDTRCTREVRPYTAAVNRGHFRDAISIGTIRR